MPPIADTDLPSPGGDRDAGAAPAASAACAMVAGTSRQGDAFDTLFGPTAERTVESAAVRIDEAADARRPSPHRVLVFSTGERVVVEGTIVVGRNPGLPGADGATTVMARGVTVAGPTVSRRHAVVRVDRRPATVEDLGSSNGTWLVGSCGPRTPVRAGEPAELAPGTIVDLGGAVSFAVEDLA